MKFLGWSVEGVEVDPQAVMEARAVCLEVRLGSLKEPQYPSNYFNIITMNHVVEHLHDPVGLLQECHRILQPKGKLLILIPNLKSLGHRFFRSAWIHIDSPRHLYLYGFHALCALAERAGFKVQSLVGIAPGAPFSYVGSSSIAKNGTYIPELCRKL